MLSLSCDLVTINSFHHPELDLPCSISEYCLKIAFLYVVLFFVDPQFNSASTWQHNWNSVTTPVVSTEQSANGELEIFLPFSFGK